MIKSLILFSILISLYGCASNSVDDNPNYKKAEIYYAQGTDQLMSKEYTKALDSLIKSNELRPNATKTLNNLGMAYYFKGQKKIAVTFLKKAIDVDAKNSDAKNNLASVYYNMGMLKEAKEVYQSVTEDLVYEHQYRVRFNLALIALKEGDASEAKELLLSSIEDNPSYCASYFKLGELAKAKQNYNEALDYFIKGGKDNCYELPAPIYEQGVTYMMLKNFNKAQEKLALVIERFPSSSYAALAATKSRQLEKLNKQELSDNTEDSSAHDDIRTNKHKNKGSKNLFESPKF
jgi:tetratricopeptide (TPR) repeat protein